MNPYLQVTDLKVCLKQFLSYAIFRIKMIILKTKLRNRPRHFLCESHVKIIKQVLLILYSLHDFQISVLYQFICNKEQ